MIVIHFTILLSIDSIQRVNTCTFYIDQKRQPGIFWCWGWSWITGLEYQRNFIQFQEKSLNSIRFLFNNNYAGISSIRTFFGIPLHSSKNEKNVLFYIFNFNLVHIRPVPLKRTANMLQELMYGRATEQIIIIIIYNIWNMKYEYNVFFFSSFFLL